MKTRIKYIDITTKDGARIAEFLICQGWKIGRTENHKVQFFKIY
jgi:hypothetical protein